MPAAQAAPKEERPSQWSGLMNIAAALAIRHFSPELFFEVKDTPLVAGSPLHAVGVTMVVTLFMFAFFDFLSSPRAVSSGFSIILSMGMHDGAVRWLNKGAVFHAGNPVDIDRALIFTTSLVYAFGDELLLHYALPPLVPPFPWADELLGATVPTGIIVSVVVYAWFRGGDNGDDCGIAALLGAANAFAAWAGGLVAGIATNFLLDFAIKSLYFHQLAESRARLARTKGKERKDKEANASSGSTKKKK